MDIADTGAGIEARGLGALGQGFGNLGWSGFRIQQDQQRLIDFEADSRASALMTTTNDQINTELLGTPNTKEEGQPSAYEQVAARIYDENITKFFEETQMSKRRQGIIQAKLDAGKARAVSSALFASAKKTANTAWVALQIETIDAYAAMDSERIREAKEKFDEMSVIRFGDSAEAKKVAGAEWDKWIAAGQKQGSQARIDIVYEAAKVMPYAEAITYINDFKGITESERNAIITRRKRQNEIETATTNRKVRWDTLRKLNEDPQSVTDEYLEGLVKPDSLTWDDAEEFKKIRDTKNHPLTSPRAQIYFGELDRLYKAGKLTTLEYDVKNEKLTEFFEANPDATAKQVSEFFEELTKEEKEGFVWDMLTGAYKFFRKGGLPGILYRKYKEGEEEPITRTDSKGQAWKYIGDNKWRKK